MYIHYIHSLETRFSRKNSHPRLRCNLCAFNEYFLPPQSITKFLRDDYSNPDYVEMRKMLFNPYKLYTSGGVDSVIRGAMNTSAGKSDAFFTPEVSCPSDGQKRE